MTRVAPPAGAGVFLFAPLLVLAVSGCGEETKAGKPPPPTVLVETVQRQDVPLYIDAVASIDGYVNAEIRARVSGFLEAQKYKDGSYVEEGEVLFTIERTEYVAAVAAAKAQLERARVAVARNRLQLQRDQGLFKSGVVSQQELDNAAAAAADASSQVQAAEAQLRQAELDLSYTTVRSPIDGVAGIALMRTGNLVGKDGPTLLTTVSRLEPIRVNFPISEVDYARSPKRFNRFRQEDLAWVKEQFAALRRGEPAENGDPGVELVLADGSVYEEKGVVVTVAREINRSTGTIDLQALFPNPDGFLRPGQYGRVRLPREEAGKDVLAVPDRALIDVQGQYSVGVVGDDNKVELRRIEVGPGAEGRHLVLEGLSGGERIVVEGTQKLKSGAEVTPKPAPAADSADGGPSGAGGSAGSAEPGAAPAEKKP